VGPRDKIIRVEERLAWEYTIMCGIKNANIKMTGLYMTKRSVRFDTCTVYIQIGRKTKLDGGEKIQRINFRTWIRKIITVLYSIVV